MNRKYLLSICMMVKDEEENLRRCLESLKTLLDKRDVELIVVDTGSRDRTVNIACEYTDKVYFHPWNNHFSDMRNITISHAGGERIFIIDADEVLLDPELLYELVSDNRLESYNTYILKIKNLDSSGGFTILPQERVFRNDGEFRYEGAVHNQPKFKPPILNTDIYIEHYGYLFSDKELMERKFIRTGGILKEELKKNPENPYYRFQLARSYNAHGDRKEALIEIRKAYGIISRDKKSMSKYAYIYGVYAMICCENNEFEEAIGICQEGIEIRPDYIDLYYMMAVAMDKTGKKPDAAVYFKKYIDLVEKYGELQISADRAIEMYYTGPQYRDVASGFVANELYNLGEYREAYKYIKKIHDKKDRVANTVKVLLKIKDLDELMEIYRENANEKALRNIIIDTIEAQKENLSPDYNKEIERVFCEGDDIYSILNKVRCNKGEDNSLLIEQAVKMADFNDLPVYYADLFANIDSNTRQVISIFKRMKKTLVSRYTMRLLDKREGLKRFLEEYLLKENIRPNDIQGLRVYVGMSHALLLNEAILLRKIRGQVPDNYYTLFKLYIEKGIRYTELLYNQERLRLYYGTLEDQEDRFFAAMRYATESIDKGDFKSRIRYFAEAVKANPYMVCYMKKYRDELFPDMTNIGGEDILNEQSWDK